MYKLCKSERSAARQRELEEGLLFAMEASRYEDISVSDLCRQMNIPRKSFYRYFESKDGALHALIDHTLMEFELFDQVEKYETRTALHALERFFLFWTHHDRLLNALRSSGLSGVLIQRGIAQALNEGTAFQRLSPLDSDYMKEQATTFAVCGLMSILVQWHATGCRHSPQEMAQLTAHLLTRPLFPNPNAIL